jgi:TfoX/Sxy family transcriptional regulator of competence genes
MAFDEHLDERLSAFLAKRKGITRKKMFGSACYLLNGNLLVGIWKDSLIVRLGPDAADDALTQPNVVAFDVTGKPMKNWIMVRPAGIEDDDALAAWIELAFKFVRKLPAK